MAVVAHRIWKEIDGGDPVIDDVAEVILAIDDAVDDTDAKVRARAVTVLNAALGAGKFPTGYFDNNFNIASVYATAGEVTVINGRYVYNTAAA